MKENELTPEEEELLHELRFNVDFSSHQSLKEQIRVKRNAMEMLQKVDVERAKEN